MEKILKNLIGPSKGSVASSDSGSAESPTKSAARFDDDPDARMEDKLRQKAFAHYDVQSLTAKTVHAVSLCAVLAKRRNTTTGASAASQASAKNDEGHDAGDNRSNDMVLACPYFRNELGGEEERVVSLCRETGQSRALNQATLPFLHRPSLACGLSLLEDANERRWRLKSCPYQRLTNEKSFIIENLDLGATYYREHFYGLEHQNWFGIDDNVGPIAISIRKERIGAAVSESSSSSESNQIKYQYRLIMRTSDLSVMRGTVYEGCVPGLSHSSSRHNHHLNHHAKEVLEYLVPEISLSCLRLGVLNADEQLLKLDEQVLTRTYKVGVLFCRDGQGSEEEMYNNEHSSPALDEFLTILGDKVPLKGFPKYRAGLDSKTDTTGTHSVYATFNDCEIMFHVSTLLPYTANNKNKQQLLRKRHIGNDIVTIIFQEPHAKPFTPKTIRSHFQHVFILVRQVAGSSPTKYSVAVSRSKEVPVFGPPIAEGGVYTKSKAFSEFLLSKVMNAENAAHRSDKFRSMAQRTRFEYLKDLACNYISNTTLSDVSIGTSAGAKLVSSIFGASRKSRSNRGSHFVGDAVIRGAIMWQLSVQDYGQPKVIDCTLAISGDTFLLLEESSKELIFVVPNFSILGYSKCSARLASSNRSLTACHATHIRIYYHQGESLLLYSKDPDVDEISEIVTRLRAVSNACETQEMLLRRNSMGQLGFHVTHEGIVTDVEPFAFAWQVGLKQNFRIVEICKVAIATLDLDQVTDLLKTSMIVSVTVLPPNPGDNSPRR